MSVTAARGLRGSRRRRRASARPGKPDVALVRSTVPAVGAAHVDDEPRPGGAGDRLEAHLALARAAGGRRSTRASRTRRPAPQGEADARRDGRRASPSALGLATEEVLVLSTGVIGARCPIDKVLAGVARPPRALSPDGGDAAAEAILTTDSGPKIAVVTRDGFTVGGMAKGAGMIHPRLATMLAVVTTDYPLAPGEADGVPAARRRAELQPDLGRRRLLDERRRRPARERRERRRARRRRAFAAALDEVCADLARQIVADGEGATVVLEIDVTGAADRGRGARRSPGGSPPRRSSRPPPSATTRTGAACSPRPARRRATAASPSSIRTAVTRLVRRRRPCSSTARRPALEPELAGAVCRIELDLGLGDGRGGVPRLRPLVRLRADQRGVHDVSRVVLKLGGRVAAEAAAARARPARRRGTTSSSCTAPARRSPPRWSGAGSHRRSSTGGA